MVLTPTCKKFSGRFLRTGALSSSLLRRPSYGEWPRMQEKTIFSCIAAHYLPGLSFLPVESIRIAHISTGLAGS